MTENTRLEPSDLLSVREVMTLFRICRRTVNNWQGAGILRLVKIGHTNHYLRSDVEALVRGQATKAVDTTSRMGAS